MAMLHPEEPGAWIEDDSAKIGMEGLKRALREEVFKICEQTVQHQIARPAWLPIYVTADFLFGLVHVFFLVTVTSAIMYSYLFAFYWRASPDWKFMNLVKMTYPMGPVVLGCWAARTVYGHRNTDGTRDQYYEEGGRRKWWRMTPGYYFANLKMALLPSLGPGFIINFVLDKGIVRTGEYVDSEAYAAFMKSCSWIGGCCMWGIFAHAMGDVINSAESRREDYGAYEQVYVDPQSTTNWRQWIHKGPHLAFFVIPCPEHGTILKVFEANVRRTAGITLFVLVVWAFLFELWRHIMSEQAKELWRFQKHPWAAILLETELPSLIVNTLTMPFLIWYTWRSEPRHVLLGVKRRPSLTALLKPKAAAIADQGSRPSEVALMTDLPDEKEGVLVKVASALMNFPVHALLSNNSEVLRHLIPSMHLVPHPALGTLGPAPYVSGVLGDSSSLVVPATDQKVSWKLGHDSDVPSEHLSNGSAWSDVSLESAPAAPAVKAQPSANFPKSTGLLRRLSPRGHPGYPCGI